MRAKDVVLEAKKVRLEQKRLHILEQIQALEKSPNEIMGKINATLLDKPEEVKFQKWRIAVVDELMGKSIAEIKKEIRSMHRQGKVFSARDRALLDLLKYAAGELK